MEPIKNNLFPFKNFYFFYFATLAAIFPFLPLFFKEQGFNGSQIGALMAVGPIVTVIAQPLWGLVCDHWQNRVKILQLTLLGSMIMLLFFPWPSKIIYFYLLIAAYTFFQSPIVPISDSILLGQLEQSKSSYGMIRLWGSLGFTVAVVLLGLVQELISLKFLFYCSAILFFVTFLVAQKMPPEAHCPSQQVLKGVRKLLKDPAFVLFLGYGFLIQWAFSAHNTFFSLYYQEIGGPPNLLGVPWAIAAASEIPVFFYTQRWLKKWGYQNLLLFAGAVYGIRWLLFSFLLNPYLVIIAQGLQGISFGIFYGAAVTYVNKQVPSELRTTGQTIFWAFTFGLGASLGSFLGGIVIENQGVMFLYRIAALVCLTAVVSYHRLRIKY